jgi:hypothetical protein
LDAKKYLSGEKKKKNKWLRWLYMTKHERKNWRDPKCNVLYLAIISPGAKLNAVVIL